MVQQKTLLNLQLIQINSNRYPLTYKGIDNETAYAGGQTLGQKQLMVLKWQELLLLLC
jgi:hypothetical protein